MPTNTAAALATHLAAGLPQVEPVLLVSHTDPFDDPNWLFEPKYDGIRGILYGWDQGCEIEIFRDIEPRFQDLPKRVAEVLGGREAILDGEVVSLDRQGKAILPQLLRGEGYLAFAACDILWLDGSDLRGQPLLARKKLLAELLPEDTGPLYKILTIEEHGRALFGAISRLDLGGIVAKSQADPYGPTTIWYEIRNPERTSRSDGPGEVLRQRARHWCPGPDANLRH